MKLLIVDDEPKIRKGLYHHFLASDFGFETVETAENGLDALEKAREIKPDIVLADICMPGMDGLEFIDKISSELPHIKKIIISGHDDFSYAQKAIRHGVTEYMLKPIDLPKLDSLMQKVCNDITTREERVNYTLFALNIIDKNKDVLINDLFARLLNGELEKDEAENAAAHMGIKIPDPAGYMAVKVVDKLPKNNNVWELELLLFAIRNIMDELCQQLDSRIFFTDAKHNLMLLYAYDSEVDYKSLQDEILKTVELCLGYTIKIDMATIKDTCVNLPVIYQEALRRLFHTNEFSQIVMEAKSYIEQNYYKESLSLQDVADAIQANPSYLSKLMNKQLGMSFVDYLTSVRMQKAVILLNNSERDVKLYEISQKLGYSSQHYFSRVFTKYYGISPIQYRMKGDGSDA